MYLDHKNENAHFEKNIFKQLVREEEHDRYQGDSKTYKSNIN